MFRSTSYTDIPVTNPGSLFWKRTVLFDECSLVGLFIALEICLFWVSFWFNFGSYSSGATIASGSF